MDPSTWGTTTTVERFDRSRLRDAPWSGDFGARWGWDVPPVGDPVRPTAKETTTRRFVELTDDHWPHQSTDLAYGAAQSVSTFGTHKFEVFGNKQYIPVVRGGKRTFLVAEENHTIKECAASERMLAQGKHVYVFVGSSRCRFEEIGINRCIFPEKMVPPDRRGSETHELACKALMTEVCPNMAEEDRKDMESMTEQEADEVIEKKWYCSDTCNEHTEFDATQGYFTENRNFGPASPCDGCGCCKRNVSNGAITWTKNYVSDEFFRLVDSTGRRLHISDDNRVLLASSVPDAFWGAMWREKPHGEGFQIVSRWRPHLKLSRFRGLIEVMNTSQMIEDISSTWVVTGGGQDAFVLSLLPNRSHHLNMLDIPGMTSRQQQCLDHLLCAVDNLRWNDTVAPQSYCPLAGSATRTGFYHPGEPCHAMCGGREAGPCDWCGTEGLCCRHPGNGFSWMGTWSQEFAEGGCGRRGTRGSHVCVRRE